MSLTGPPDCFSDQTGLELTVGPLADGPTAFQIAVIDQAGNCGPPTTFQLRIDDTPDSVVNLRALTGPAGLPINSGSPQQDTSPLLLWDASVSTGPIAGYSYAVGTAANCTVDTPATEVQLAGLPEGSPERPGRVGETAEPVVDQPNTDAGPRLGGQELGELPPRRVLVDDVALEMDGALGRADYREFALPHTKSIFDRVKSCGVPMIHFGVGATAILGDLAEAGGDVIGLDWREPLDEGWARVPDRGIQGNLDPALLLGPVDRMLSGTRDVLARAGGRSGHIFNLGHGIQPPTPLEHVQELARFVHQETRTSTGP